MILQERSYFTDLTFIIEDLIAELEKQIKNKKTIKSRDSFNVALKDFGKIKITFYSEYSKKARDYIKEKNDPNFKPSAIFFSEKTDDLGGIIELYINKLKPSYYKNRKFTTTVSIQNGRLPKFIKDALRHELTHAYEDVLYDDHMRKDIDHEDYYSYVNSDAEVNAFFNERVLSLLHHDPLIKTLLNLGNVQEIMRKIINIIKYDEVIYHMSDANKKWLLKTMYTTIIDLIEKTTIQLRPGMANPHVPTTFAVASKS